MATKILIQHHAERLHHIDGVMLMPGINEVDAERFGEWMKLPAFKALVDDEVITQLEAGDRDMTRVDFGKLKEKDALELVANTMRKELLESFAEETKSKKVLAAIDAQLKKIDPRVKPEDESTKA